MGLGSGLPGLGSGLPGLGPESQSGSPEKIQSGLSKITSPESGSDASLVVTIVRSLLTTLDSTDQSKNSSPVFSSQLHLKRVNYFLSFNSTLCDSYQTKVTEIKFDALNEALGARMKYITVICKFITYLYLQVLVTKGFDLSSLSKS